MGQRQSEAGSVVTMGVQEMWLGRVGATDPACLALVLDSLFGVRHGPLHVVHRLLHVVLDPVNHLPLQGQGHPSSREPPSGPEGGLRQDFRKVP